MSTIHITRESAIRYLFGSALILGGLIHWFIIFGVLHEKAPFVLTLYFHSLAVLDICAGWGLITRKRYGYMLALFIGITQIPAHGYMLVLDLLYTYGSGVTTSERIIDIAFSTVLVLYCTVMLTRPTPTSQNR